MKCPMCIILVYLYFVTCLYAQYPSCVTPEKKPGACVRIGQCPRLLALVQRRPLPNHVANYLQLSTCGFENYDPRVCCTFDENVQPTPKDTTSKIELLPNTDECGYIGDPKLLGGEEADLFDFPWMALLEYQTPNGRSFNCAGVLISKRYVLTAAHCILEKGTSKRRKLVSVRLGEHNIATDPDCEVVLGEKVCMDKPINVPVVELIPHESFKPSSRSQDNDIALLRLARDVEFTDFVKPICTPISQKLQNYDFVGTNMTVAGWGRTEKLLRSNVKLKLTVPVKSHQECKSAYDRNHLDISSNHICAGGSRGKDSCTGDSGGPLMTIMGGRGVGNWYVGGIVSFGPTPCGLEGWPGVYTRVTKYIPWILSNLQP